MALLQGLAYVTGDFTGTKNIEQAIYGVNLQTEQLQTTSERVMEGITGAAQLYLTGVGMAETVPAATTPKAEPPPTVTSAPDAPPVQATTPTPTTSAPYTANGVEGVNSMAGGGTAPGSGNVASVGGTQAQYYIENGVRRSVASQQAGLNQIPAIIYQEGQAPISTILNLDQLFSPKFELPLDPRFLNIQPPIQVPIEVQPLGLPGQMPTVPLNQIKLIP